MCVCVCGGGGGGGVALSNNSVLRCQPFRGAKTDTNEKLAYVLRVVKMYFCERKAKEKQKQNKTKHLWTVKKEKKERKKEKKGRSA